MMGKNSAFATFEWHWRIRDLTIFNAAVGRAAIIQLRKDVFFGRDVIDARLWDALLQAGGHPVAILVKLLAEYDVELAAPEANLCAFRLNWWAPA